MGIPSRKGPKTKMGRHYAFYSRPKMGKSTFLMEALIDAGDDGLLLLCGEDGVSEHEELVEQVLTYTDDNDEFKVFGANGHESEWEEFLAVLGKLINEWAAPGKVLGLDSVNTLVNGATTKYVIETYFEDEEKHDKKAGGMVTKTKREQAFEYGGNKLCEQLKIEMSRFYKYLAALKKKGVIIHSTWHSAATKWKNPMEDVDYDKISVDLPSTKKGDLKSQLMADVSCLLYADIETASKAKSTRRNGDKVYLFSKVSPMYDSTKIRGLDIPDQIPFDFKSFKKLLTKES